MTKLKTNKHAPIKVYGELAKVTLADSNNKPDTKTEAAKPNANGRRRSKSQPTK